MLSLPEARNVIYAAAERWAEELAEWIIPGADDEDDRAGYQRQLSELEIALMRIRQESYNGYTPED